MESFWNCLWNCFSQNTRIYTFDFFNYLFPPSLLSNASELMFRSRRSEPSVSRSGVSGPGALEVVIARVRRMGRKGESPLLFI